MLPACMLLRETLKHEANGGVVDLMNEHVSLSTQMVRAKHVSRSPKVGGYDEPTSRDTNGARFKYRVKLGPGMRLPATVCVYAGWSGPKVSEPPVGGLHWLRREIEVEGEAWLIVVLSI